MSHIFIGHLCGYICHECPEDLSNIAVRLYAPHSDHPVTAMAVADPKETIALLTDEQIKSRSEYLLAEGATNENGRFEITLPEKYNGEAIEIDVYLESVPGQKAQKDKPQPRQVTITTVQPRWRQVDDNLVAKWEYCLPHRMWCAIRGLFGAWVICGHVVDCEQKRPIAGVTVKAFDKDWITDDPLGSAVTDATGRFRIDYTTADFHVTFLSPWINVETPWPPFDSGPDVYFHVESAGGIALLTEDRNRGLDPDRANVGPCFCVQLCLDEPPDDTPPPTIPLFTKVGKYSVIPADGDFTSDGLTTSGNLAFTGTIPLRGILPDGTNPYAVEYRFRVAEYNAAGTVLGPLSDVDASMIVPTIIGQLEYWDWAGTSWKLKAADYWVNNPSIPPLTIHQPGPDLTVNRNVNVKAGGWIEVPTDDDLTIGGAGRFIGGFGEMINLDTTKLNDEHFDLVQPPPALKAGESVPAAKRSRPHIFKLFFEARQVMGGSPVSSNDLEKIVCTNLHYKQLRHPNWAGGEVTLRAVVMLDISELSGPGGGCGQIEDELHAQYSVYHPFVDDVRVYFEGNPPLPADFTPAIVAGEAASTLAGHFFDTSAMDPCAYILWLRADLALTRGYGRISDSHIWDHIAFCKE